MSTDRRETAAGEVHQDPAELRRRRREVALRLHPDRGGDAHAFDAAMRELDVLGSAPAGRSGVVAVRATAVTRTWRSTRSAGRRVVRDLRGRLPRSVPGSRRYGHL